MQRISLLAMLCAAWLGAAERQVDPTFLRREVPAAVVKPGDISAAGCRYKPLFGQGDEWARLARGVARYGEITLDPGGACNPVSYPREEQVYFILEGQGAVLYGEEKHAVRREDFLYLPPGVRHALLNASEKPCRAVVMGFRIPADAKITLPPKLLIANAADVPKQVVGGHPPSTLYRLLMGDTRSTRDRIAAGHLLTSLFIMEFAPGGTNFPHHHEREEEIYLVLDGRGDMVAGGGTDGVEGRHPAKPGDAYFFRLNCTVGFYASSDGPARILAVRSLFPGR